MSGTWGYDQFGSKELIGLLPRRSMHFQAPPSCYRRCGTSETVSGKLLTEHSYDFAASSRTVSTQPHSTDARPLGLGVVE
jgi:hypothetical protein